MRVEAPLLSPSEKWCGLKFCSAHPSATLWLPHFVCVPGGQQQCFPSSTQGRLCAWFGTSQWCCLPPEIKMFCC